MRLLSFAWRRLGLVTRDEVDLLRGELDAFAAQIDELELMQKRLDDAARAQEPRVRIHRGAPPPP